MATFRELADSLGVERPDLTPLIEAGSFGEIVRLRLEYIEAVIAAVADKAAQNA